MDIYCCLGFKFFSCQKVSIKYDLGESCSILIDVRNYSVLIFKEKKNKNVLGGC